MIHSLITPETPIYRLWELTEWDKRFQAVAKEKQPTIWKLQGQIPLGSDIKSSFKEEGDVEVLGSGRTLNRVLSSEFPNFDTGEGVTISYGGGAHPKYFNGKFLNAGNRTGRSKDPSVLDNKYLFWVLKSDEAKINSYYRGGALKHVDLRLFLEHQVPLPPLEDQKRIASYLDDLTGAIEISISLQQDTIELLKQEKVALWNRIFDPAENTKFRLGGEGIDTRDWTIACIGDLANFSPDKRPERPDRFIYLSLSSVQNGHVVNEEWFTRETAPGRAQLLLREGDIIYQGVRPNHKNSMVISSEYAGHVASTGFIQLRPKSDLVDTHFLHQLLTSEFVSNRAMAVAGGSMYPAISGKQLGAIRSAVPSLRDQVFLSEYFSHLDSQIKLEQERLDLLREQKAAYNGRIFNIFARAL